MLELEKWGASKPDKYIVMIAHDFATGADALYQFLLSTKNRRRPEGYFDLPHVNKWLKFYDKDKTIIDYLISKFKEDEDDLDSDDFDLKELIDQVRALRKGDKYFLAKLEKEKKLLGPEGFRIKERMRERNLQSDYQSHLKDLREEIRGEIDESENRKELDEILKDDYMQFFIRVYCPCWFLHGRRPDQLMEQARQGHLDSLEKLLRIDKAIVRDENIAQLIHQTSTQRNLLKYDSLMAAYSGSPNKKISLSKVKASCAGFISTISLLFGNRLYEPDLRALFNAVAVDFGHHEQIDEDIPADPASFSKAILRERKFWINNIFHLPDKTI